MQKIQDYLVGALLMFGSATWAAIYAENVSSVIAVLSVPSLLADYIYGTASPQYVWGMLLEICCYMAVEFFMYGPVYKTTGLIYGIAFFVSLSCAVLGYALLCWKTRKIDSPSQGQGSV